MINGKTRVSRDVIDISLGTRQMTLNHEYTMTAFEFMRLFITLVLLLIIGFIFVAS